jgi:predicted RNA-binding protein
MNYWLVVGKPQNWETAFIHRNIWGLKETQSHLWESLKENDKVIFYVTSPVKGVIGHGVIRTKFHQYSPLWPDEIKQRKVIWPLRFEFDVDFRLPQGKWANERVVSKELMPRAGFQLLSKDLGVKLIASMGTGEYVAIEGKASVVSDITASYLGGNKEEEKTLTPHEDIKKSLVEIGKMQGYIAEPEYPCDGNRLDVVWKKLDRAVPTRVFEIHVSGDIYHALGKLKHASDLWNSHIFIVAPEVERDKVNNLLSGTFHEIGSHISFIEIKQVEELYKRKKSYLDFEKELGI